MSKRHNQQNRENSPNPVEEELHSPPQPEWTGEEDLSHVSFQSDVLKSSFTGKIKEFGDFFI